jgi:hypothetical protein
MTRARSAILAVSLALLAAQLGTVVWGNGIIWGS